MPYVHGIPLSPVPMTCREYIRRKRFCQGRRAALYTQSMRKFMRNYTIKPCVFKRFADEKTTDKDSVKVAFSGEKRRKESCMMLLGFLSQYNTERVRRFPNVEKEKKQTTNRLLFLLERSGWDSNPRALSRKTLSRRPRYDHFDTAP